MRTNVPCPLCQSKLTFIAQPRDVSCPFCRATIKGSLREPALGKKVQCANCSGAFTAQSLPPSVRLFTVAPEPCPECHRLLAIASDLPAGKKVRCKGCGAKFVPRQSSRSDSHSGPEHPELPTNLEAPAGDENRPQQVGEPVGTEELWPLEDPQAVAAAATLAVAVAEDWNSTSRALDDTGTETEMRDTKTDHPATPTKPTVKPLRPAAAKPKPGPLPAGKKPIAKKDSKPAAPAIDPATRQSEAEDAVASLLLEPSTEAPANAQASAAPVVAEEIPMPDPPPRPAAMPAPVRAPAVIKRGEPDDEDDDTSSKRAKYLLIALVALFVLVCCVYIFTSSGPRRLSVYPTEGIVLFQGKPAVGARVTLIPEDKQIHFLPTGIVGDDGKFKLTTHVPNDGAPPGKYRVSISRGRLDGDELAALKKKHTPEEVEQILAEKAEDPLYSRFLNTGMTAVIPAPDRILRFELD